MNVGEYDDASDFFPAVLGRLGVAGLFKIIESEGIVKFENGYRLVIPHANTGTKELRKLKVHAPSGAP